jgi:NAD dependent epimerase/dehydratase
VKTLDGASILVTGADGFIGSHLVERLVAEGAQVRAFCLYNSNGSFGWLDEVPEESLDSVELCLGDVRDRGFVEAAMVGMDIVFHLAALIAIPYSYLAPASFIDTNVLGTLNVLEAARRTDVSKIVQTSTSEVYGTPETVPITEQHSLHAQSPYSASKIAADKLCESFALSFGLPVVILRPFNTYGPRQSARAVIPTILEPMLAGARKIPIGSLNPRRDFTFVGDTVEGFVRMAMADLIPGEVIQLGTGTDLSIAELFELCRDITGADAEVLVENERIRPERSEVPVLLADPSRAAERLGWRPTVDPIEGIRRVADWLRGRPSRALAGYQR